MRNPAVLVVILGIWLAAPGCLFLHDAGCQDDSDCDTGRVCDDGECVAQPSQGSGALNVAEGGGAGTSMPSTTPNNQPSGGSSR